MTYKEKQQEKQRKCNKRQQELQAAGNARAKEMLLQMRASTPQFEEAVSFSTSRTFYD